MPKQSMKWVPRMGYSVGGNKVKFRGREPFAPDNRQHARNLLMLGVFEALGDGTMRYSAPIKLRCACPGGMEHVAWVGPDGSVDVDLEHLAKDLLDAGIEYELCQAGKPIPPPVWTKGFDHPDHDPATLKDREEAYRVAKAARLAEEAKARAQ